MQSIQHEQLENLVALLYDVEHNKPQLNMSTGVKPTHLGSFRSDGSNTILLNIERT